MGKITEKELFKAYDIISEMASSQINSLDEHEDDEWVAEVENALDIIYKQLFFGGER